MATTKKEYALTVPIDIGKAENAAKSVRVALVDAQGRVLQSHVVATSGKQPSATFELEAPPRGARVVVGPENADDESLSRMETVSVNVASNVFAREKSATLRAISIAPYYWEWWLRWCRDFTITGTVLCPDGKPVPGAQVCAFDVDWFWFWQSKQQIGCVTTDANGVFHMTFRWCCSLWPWWWWYLRTWEIDYRLLHEIYAALPPEARVKPIPLPDPVPDLHLIEQLIPASQHPAKLRSAVAPVRQQAGASVESLKASTSEFFTRAEALRPVLADLVPIAKYKIWPWYPWYPWRDCNPDLIFRVTQFCDGEVKTILDQGYAQTQWDIPTSYNVTLIANGEACCGEDTPCGDPCLSITHVCDIPRAAIDQTSGGPLAGLANPGAASVFNQENADRPFAEAITVQGLPQCMGDDVDYYEVESSLYDPNTSTWGAYAPIPLTSLNPFSRTYFTGATVPWVTLSFVPTVVDGHVVYPSRKTLETSLVSPWLCYSGCQVLFVWATSSGAWQDGTYRLRLRAYKDQAGSLVEQQLPPCDDGDPNEIIISIDNRVIPDPGHVPAGTPGHMCGSGTVHLCSKEPDVDVQAVRLVRADGTIESIQACGIYTRQPGDTIEIDFEADDRNKHLASYSLIATYGENTYSDLLTSTNLNTNGADAKGPTYYLALTQGVTAPEWAGGSITVQVPAAQMALKFPTPCCYQLELRAYKRPIVGCSIPRYDNLAEYSFFY